MELETQNHVCTNQIRRQDDEHKRLEEAYEASQSAEKDLQAKLRERKDQLVDLESKVDFESFLWSSMEQAY